MSQRAVVYCDICNSRESIDGAICYGSRSQAVASGWSRHRGIIDVCPRCSALPDIEERVAALFEEEVEVER